MLTWNCSVRRQSSRTEFYFSLQAQSAIQFWLDRESPLQLQKTVSAGTGWILWRLLPFKPLLNDYSRCVVI